MMPSRFWRFDREKYQLQLDRLRLAAAVLSQNQIAFEGSLTPQQLSKFDPEVNGVHQLQTELQFRIQSLDDELKEHQFAKWRIAEDTTAIPKLTKEWRKRDQRIGREIGIPR